MKDIFDLSVTAEVIARINRLTAASKPQWGRMAVGQMLAHCCKPYEMLFDPSAPRMSPIARFFAKVFAKKMVVGPAPYRRNGPTAPAFRIVDTRDFAVEKERLIGFLHKTQQLGRQHFDGKESPSFGPLTAAEWNTLFYKHLDHHLTQFGV